MIANGLPSPRPSLVHNMSLKSINGVLLSRNGHLCTTCCADQFMTILYEWDPPTADLDTGTTFLGGTVGWSCGGVSAFITWISGDNTDFGPEEVRVQVRESHAAGAWVSSVEIHCAAGWFGERDSNPPARIRVTFNGVTKTMSFSPGFQDACATTQVGKITVHDDWTFTLTGP